MTKEELHRKCVQWIEDNHADLVTCDTRGWFFVKPIQRIEPPEELEETLNDLVQEVDDIFQDFDGQDDAIYYLLRKLGEEDV